MAASFTLGACVNLTPPARPVPLAWGPGGPQPVYIRAVATENIRTGQLIDVDMATGHATLARTSS